MPIKHTIVFITFIAICFTAGAQVYQTRSGLITINGRYKGAAIAAESRQLHMSVNYSNSGVVMHLAIPQLITKNVSLNAILAKMTGSELVFRGILNNTQPHQKIKQQVIGTVTLNNVTMPFNYSTVLEHFPSGDINCVLTGDFVIDLLQFNVPVLPDENKVSISFKELVLKKINDQ